MRFPHEAPNVTITETGGNGARGGKCRRWRLSQVSAPYHRRRISGRFAFLVSYRMWGRLRIFQRRRDLAKRYADHPIGPGQAARRTSASITAGAVTVSGVSPAVFSIRRPQACPQEGEARALSPGIRLHPGRLRRARVNPRRARSTTTSPSHFDNLDRRPAIFNSRASKFIWFPDARGNLLGSVEYTIPRPNRHRHKYRGRFTPSV